MTCPTGVRRYLRGLLLTLSLCLLFLVVHTGAPFANAQQSAHQNLNVNPDVPINQRTAVDVLMINVMASMVCHLSGIDVMQYAPNPYNQTGTTSCLGIDRQTGKIGFVQNGEGAIGMMGGMVAMLYTPPAHTTDYTRYLARSFGIAQPAYAQATGFTALEKMINVWSVFRNITYFLFVIVFIVIGFLIMLRVKIDPRTVMGIQNTIPRLIVGIVLITFSYAIAGVLIDLMWASTYLSIGVMSQAIEQTDGETTFTTRDATETIQDYPFSFFNRVFAGNFVGIGILGTLEFSRNVADGVGIIFRSLTDSDPGGALDILTENIPGAVENAGNLADLTTPFGVVSPYLGDVNAFGLGSGEADTGGGCSWYNIICRAGNAITGVVSNLIDAVFTALFGIISWILSILAFLVILIAVIVTLFRIWFTLLRAYITILLGVVWAPFWILFGIFPGSGLNFVQWLRHMVAHLALFPATIIMFLMARVFIQVFEPTGFLEGNDNSVFLPPLVGNAALPEAIGPIIAFAILMYVPSMLNMLRDALKTPPSKYSSAPGAGIAAGVAPIKGAAGATAAYTSKVKGVGEAAGLGAVLQRLF